MKKTGNCLDVYPDVETHFVSQRVGTNANWCETVGAMTADTLPPGLADYITEVLP
jgi:hypothetical protein